MTWVGTDSRNRQMPANFFAGIKCSERFFYWIVSGARRRGFHMVVVAMLALFIIFVLVRLIKGQHFGYVFLPVPIFIGCYKRT